jgi:hypothetical protein
MSNKNFCILPFIHLATTTEGHCRLCCKVSKHDVICDDNGNPYNVNTHTINEIWNSNHYTQLRQRVLNDERLPECKICWTEEETFYSAWSKDKTDELPSKRRKENQKWLHKKTKLKDNISDIVSNPRIRYYDIRLSNLCNLKCRMCWPHFSSQIVKEQQQFAKQNLPTHYNDYNVEEWNTDKLWKGISDNSIDIEEITFVGGEPTLHDEMYELLEQLVVTGVSKNIRLKITTNLTNLQTRFLDLFDKFKTVVINGSIDGVGNTNEYIRHPSDWNTIERNIDLILETNALLNLTPVIQIYNIFKIDELVKWYTNKWIEKELCDKFILDLDLLYDPNYLSVKLLNTHGKETWYWNVYTPTIEYLDSIIKNIEIQSKKVQNYWKVLDTLRTRLVNIALYTEAIGYDDNGKLQYWFAKSTVENVKSLRQQCIDYTSQLDTYRKQSVYDIIPNFKEIINDST